MTDAAGEKKGDTIAPITHAIFDVDGLLLDTEKIYTIATQSILSRFNKTFEWSLKSRMMGREASEAAKLLISELQIPLTPEEYLAEREMLHMNLMPTCELMPGAERLIRHLHACSVPICVATSSHRNLYEVKTSRHRDVFDLFDHEVCGDDQELKRGKPAPDIFLLAANRFTNNKPANSSSCLVFEDSPAGITAATAAKMHSVFVPDPRVDTANITASCVLSSLEAFKPEQWNWPKFKE